MATSKNLKPAEPTPIQTPDRLIALAIESNADVEKLERLFDLQERYNTDIAKKAYYEALSAFQANSPSIPKTKQVENRDGTPRYAYAPLDGILKTLREPLREQGFSWRFECAHSEGALLVTCVLTHIGGHAESSTVTVPSFAGQGTNAAQDEGSAMSYGKRYSFSNLTGITPDEDDDGETAAPQTMPYLMRQQEALRANFASVAAIKAGFEEGGDLDIGAEAYAELDRKTLNALTSLAPTKGGVFTTEERKRMKEDSDFKDKVHILRTDAGWYDDPENQT